MGRQNSNPGKHKTLLHWLSGLFIICRR